MNRQLVPLCAVALGLVAGAPALIQPTGFEGSRWAQPAELKGVMIASPILALVGCLLGLKRGIPRRDALILGLATFSVTLLAMLLCLASVLWVTATVVDIFGIIASLVVGYAVGSYFRESEQKGSHLSRRNRHTTGLSLVELLVVVAIVGLLVGLVVPTYRYAIRQGHKGDSTARLRQVFIAFSQYADLNDGSWPVGLDPMVDTGMLPSSILLNPWDSSAEGFGTRFNQCVYPPGFLFRRRVHSSFEDILGPRDAFRRRLEALDPNHGIVVDRTVGRVRHYNPRCPDQIEWAYEGPLLRLRVDGSVQRAVYRDPGVPNYWTTLHLYTDKRPTSGGD